MVIAREPFKSRCKNTNKSSHLTSRLKISRNVSE